MITTRLMNLSSIKLNLIFLFIMIGGSAIILSSFYFIDINALTKDDEIFSVKDKVMGIGIFIVMAHVLLTYTVKSIFKKLHKASTTIEEKNVELVKIDRAKTEFVSMITHELRTPIVPIMGYSKMLLGEKFGTLNNVQKEKLKIIISGTESLQILIQDILDLHKADLGKLKFTLEFVDIKDVIHNAVDVTLPIVNRRGAVLEDLTSSGVNVMVDKNRMVQVLTNLIKNAADFVPLEEGKIKIQQETRDGNLTISIIDNGSGIPKEKIDK